MKLYDYYRSTASYRVRITLNLKQLAFEMQTRRKRSIDRSFAVHIIARLNTMRKDEKDLEFNKRMDQWFDDIESRCGLLKFENSQYSYWHLTHQEFLAADYISDNSSDHRTLNPGTDHFRNKL